MKRWHEESKPPAQNKKVGHARQEPAFWNESEPGNPGGGEKYGVKGPVGMVT